jgi:hypothetical protein
MVLLHGICGKITMHFMKRYFHGLKGTAQLSFGNLSTTANISMSISNSDLLSISNSVQTEKGKVQWVF